MDLLVERVNVWASSIADEPGGLCKVLSGLSEAGCDLDFVIARRCPDRPGEGVLFVTPILSDAQIDAASEIGFNATQSVHSLRIEGENKPGIGAGITKKLADAGINLRGLSAAVLGPRFVAYIGLDSESDAEKAESVLTSK